MRAIQIMGLLLLLVGVAELLAHILLGFNSIYIAFTFWPLVVVGPTIFAVAMRPPQN